MPRASAAAAAATGPDEIPDFAMPATPFYTIKQYQALFILMAQAEVRQRGTQGTLSVAQQQTHLLESFKRYITLWYRDDATVCNQTNMPSCPNALRNLGSEQSVVRAMLATCGNGRRCHTGETLRNKAKDLKKDMLKLVAIWNVCCKVSANASVIGYPGTGEDHASIYAKLIRVAYRVQETQRVMKLRVAWHGVQFEQQHLCTLEKIKEAYASHFYATRGISLVEQTEDTRRFALNGRSARFSIRRQIDELVEAELQVVPIVPVQNRPPPDAQSRNCFEEVF
jgi:hypothetical protein